MQIKYEDQLHDFIVKDHLKTLFPLNSTKLITQYALNDILTYINNDILNNENKTSFFVQPWVYALKDNKHVRQTFLLDPFAQIFIYDFVFRNKDFFVRKNNDNRQSYGYSFSGETYNSPSDDFRMFSERKYELKSKYKYMGKLDVANCFNNFYHHDIVSFVSMLINEEESRKIGKFLREINGGRSTSCMPQGLFPAKVLGNFYLKFIEDSRELQSEHIIRFMDDVYLFSDYEQNILDDMLIIQRLLGDKGLYLNEEKTRIHLSSEDAEQFEIEDSKKTLLQKRREIINSYTGEVEDKVFDPDEVEYLKDKLQDAKHLDDDDIELILSVLSTNEAETIELVRLVLYKFPHLAKNLYFSIMRNLMYLNEEIVMLIELYIREKVNIQEYQLFWISKILIDFTVINEHVTDILFLIYKHNSATNVVKCLILELQENSYGLLDLKKNIVRGNASELVISSIIGLINLEKGNRNQIYKYVAKTNPMFSIIVNGISKLEIQSFENSSDEETIKLNYLKSQPLQFPHIPNSEIEISDDDLPF